MVIKLMRWHEIKLHRTWNVRGRNDLKVKTYMYDFTIINKAKTSCKYTKGQSTTDLEHII